MQPLASKDIFGNWATLLLPINQDESLDYVRLENEIDCFIDAGVDGIYSNGTAGEFYSQTEEEFEKINRLLADKCKKAGVRFQIGASHMSPQLSLSRIKKAVEFKPGAIQVILPDWFPINDEGAVRFLSEMAEMADPIGLVLYNPPHAKRVLRPKQFGRLKSAVPSLVGIKTAGGDDAWYSEMRENISDLSVFIPGHFMASGIMKGAQGSYSNVACLSPLGAQRWYQLIKTDMEKALALEQRIVSFMTEFIHPFIQELNYPNHACDKLLAAAGGWAEIGTRLRWPYSWIPEAEALKLRAILRERLPELCPFC